MTETNNNYPTAKQLRKAIKKAADNAQLALEDALSELEDARREIVYINHPDVDELDSAIATITDIYDSLEDTTGDYR